MENIKLDPQLLKQAERNIAALCNNARKAQGFDLSITTPTRSVHRLMEPVGLSETTQQLSKTMQQWKQRTQGLIEGLQQWNQRMQTFLAVARDELAVPKETSVVAYLLKADRKELYFLLRRQLGCAMSVGTNFAVSILTECKQFDDALQSKNPCKLLPYVRQDNLFFLTEQANAKSMATCFKRGEWHEKSEAVAAMWQSLFERYNESVYQQTFYNWRKDKAFVEELEKRGIQSKAAPMAACLQTSVEAPESSTGTTTRPAADEAENKPARRNKPQPDFKTIIQPKNGKTKEEILARLHELINGNSGSDVGAVFYKAYHDKYLIKKPNEKLFRSEFQLIGSWKAIAAYMRETNNNAKVRADQITIFD